MAETSFARNNFEGLIYLIGDETTEGSVRFLIEDGKIAAIEKRRSGAWNSSRLTNALVAGAAKANLDAMTDTARGYVKTNPESGEFPIIAIHRDANQKIDVEYDDNPEP